MYFFLLQSLQNQRFRALEKETVFHVIVKEVELLLRGYPGLKTGRKSKVQDIYRQSWSKLISWKQEKGCTIVILQVANWIMWQRLRWVSIIVLIKLLGLYDLWWRGWLFMIGITGTKAFTSSSVIMNVDSSSLGLYVRFCLLTYVRKSIKTVNV